ncbi:hypothetical protein HanPI659440_Chr08g0311531 [Helianthus annuus]|nr:hypothetical protein HanPI659440_Chr08g0311531 [Helianthus annuus]
MEVTIMDHHQEVTTTDHHQEVTITDHHQEVTTTGHLPEILLTLLLASINGLHTSKNKSQNHLVLLLHQLRRKTGSLISRNCSKCWALMMCSKSGLLLINWRTMLIGGGRS